MATDLRKPTRHDPSYLAQMPAMHMVKTPKLAQRLSRVLAGFWIALPVVLLGVPWTQTVHGLGRAIAFNPVERPQFIVAPIEGRIKRWHVVEGDRVRAGERIVEMVDNDPNLELRLLDEEKAVLDRLRAAEDRVRAIEFQIENLRSSRELAISIFTSRLQLERERVQTALQDEITAQANLQAAQPNLERLVELNKRGLSSDRDVELARQGFDTTSAQLGKARAMVKLTREGEKAAKDDLEKIGIDTEANIRAAEATLSSAHADVASVRRDKAQIEVRIARQRAQYVAAPCDGTIFRLLANAEQGGILVRPGERLAVLVPDIKSDAEREAEAKENETDLVTQTSSPGTPVAETVTSGPTEEPSDVGPAAAGDAETSSTRRTDYPGIVVELQIDGNDLPLTKPGDEVRIQFEGWPALQFSGFPSVAVGTFAGRVFLVDPTSNDKGQFRILVEPDPEQAPWPDQQYLRQGVRAQGWVLLERVTLGWELWRRLNGFPPIRTQSTDKGDQTLGPVKVKKIKT